MKRIILILTAAMFFFKSFGQQIEPAPASPKQDYLKKSKKQKTAAWILLGAGTAMIITGVALQANEIKNDPYNPVAPLTDQSESGAAFFGVGLLAAAGSIPLFIASSRNKRKAASISFKNERFQYLKNSSVVYLPMPAVSLKVSL